MKYHPAMAGRGIQFFKARRMMGRIERVNEQMRREISQMLRKDFQDPRFSLVTILHVDVTKDLRHAVVFYSVLGDTEKLEEVKTALEKLKGYVRKLIGERIRLRYTPEIRFEYDPGISYSARIEQTLAEIKATMPFDTDEQGRKEKDP